MSILSLRNVVKQYSNHRAVDGVSFDIPRGTIFGLLGPNGAGKTSIIRIITTITAADEGEVFFDGAPLNSLHPTQIGYLPEERGLYKKMTVGDQLLYLAQLKGLSAKEARDEIQVWYDKFDIADWHKKKIQELSKGMQQKIQFIATVLHKPKMIILDEPFTGLDPINTNLIKDEIHKMHEQGVSIIFSTHRMEQVEEICTDIVLINSGKKVLEGEVNHVKEQFKDNLFRIEFDGKLPDGISSEKFKVIEDTESELTIKIDPDYDSNEILKALLNSGLHIKSFNEILPSLNEIFIKQVETNSYA